MTTILGFLMAVPARAARLRWLVVAAAVVGMVVGATSATAAPKTDRGKPTPTTTVPPAKVVLEVTGQENIGLGSPIPDTPSAGVYVPVSSPPVVCAVEVPAGSSATAVLDAAVAKGCIQRYEVRYEEETWHSAARTYVHCVDDRCNATAGQRWSGPTWVAGGGLEWAQYENGTRVWMFDRLTADDGDVFRLSYRAAGGACAPVFAFSQGIACIGVVEVR